MMEIEIIITLVSGSLVSLAIWLIIILSIRKVKAIQTEANNAILEAKKSLQQTKQEWEEFDVWLKEQIKKGKNNGSPH
jgi:biopolymer transport protein ExbB/TolQ